MSSARPRPTGASAAAPGTPRSTPMRQGSSSRLSASVNSVTGNTTTTTGLKPSTKIAGTTPAKRVSLASSTTTPAASPGRGAAKSSKTPSPLKGPNSKSPDRKGAAARPATDATTPTPAAADGKTPEPAAGMGKPRLSLLRFNRDNSSTTPQAQSLAASPAPPAADVASNNASDFNNNDNASGYFISPTDADGEAPFASAFSGSYEPVGDEGGALGNAGSFAASGDGTSPPPSVAGGGSGGDTGGSKGGGAVMKDYYKSQKFQQRRASTAAVPLQGSPSLIGTQSRSTFGVGGPNALGSASFSVALFGNKSQNYFGRGLQSGASEGGSKEGGFPSPQQGGFGEEDSHLRMILEETEVQLTEARSNAESAQFRVSFLEGEQSRLQHQVQTLRGDVKKLQADIFDLTSSKAHYSKQVDDLVEEKEELQLQLLGAGLVEKKAMQDMQVEMIEMQAVVERTTATLVKKDQLISNLLNENEKLKRGKTEQREADSKHGDVQVRLHIAEKGKAVLQDKYDKEAALVAVRDEEINNLNAEIDHLNAAIERISKKTRRAGLGGAFAKALDIETPTNKKPAPSPTRHRGMSTLDGSMRGGGGSSLGNTINGGLNSTIALLDEVEHEGDDYDEAVGKYLRVIRIDRALEGFKIEREGLQALLTEGMASFQELFNAHRVMQAISYDDSKKASELMIKEEARLKAMGPAASPYSNTRRQTPSARRHASPSKSPRGHQLPQQHQPTPAESADTAPPQSPTSSVVNISITSATARSNGASPHKAPAAVSSSTAPAFDLEVSEPGGAPASTLHAPVSSPSKHLSPLQQRIARARSGSISQLGASGLGASWNGAQQVPQGSSIRSTPGSTFTPSGSPQQLSLGAGTPTTTTIAPPPPAATTTTTTNNNNRGASPRVQDDPTAFLQHHHQGEGCVGAHRKCYVTSWYCATGKDMLESWLTSMNLYSPALVNLLYNAGFVDMQALSKMTEKDMSDLQIVHGIRRKLLAGVESLRDKLQVVTDETLRMLKNSYYLSDDSYENHRHARSASVAHTDLEPTDDENEEVVDEGRLRERRQRRHVQRVARAREHLMQLQKRFSTQQRQLSLLSGTGFIPAFSADADGASEESLPTGQVSEVADPQEYHTKAVAAEAPMVLDVMLQEMQSWFADIRLAIEAQEGAVERILQSFDEEEGNTK